MSEQIVAFLSDPKILGLFVTVLLTLLPAERYTQVVTLLRGWIERFPVLGVVVKVLRLYIERVHATQQAEKVNAASHAADVLVEGAEQLKKTGKLDGATAARQITQTLVRDFDLDEDTASKVTESAVRDLNLRR